MITNNTPVEKYEVDGVPLWVKREDLCCIHPGPSFSKARGVYAHMQSRPESVIGVLDTFHSKAGWCVSWIGMELGKKVVNYWPKYKADDLNPDHPEYDKPHLRFQQSMAVGLGAELIPLKAGRSAILYHQAKRHLRDNYPDSYLMPNALKLSESVTENAAEAERTLWQMPPGGTVVISISSGTVASGVMKGLVNKGDYAFVLHMGYDRSETAVRNYINEMAGQQLEFELINEHYSYADRAPEKPKAPFPCNPYYDAKAYNWLNKPGVMRSLQQPVIFWNIGE